MLLPRGARRLVTCWRLLEPEAADADWKEVDRTVLHIDPDLGQCALTNRSSSIWRPQNGWLTGITAALFAEVRPDGKFSHVEFEIENNVLASRPNRATIIGQRVEATGAPAAKPHASISTWATSEQGLAGRKSAHRAPSDMDTSNQHRRGQGERNRDKRRNEAPDIRWPPSIDVSARNIL
ncbi:hypothetical protein [Bradyrhizobium tropiciagri]|uniref:hypothetical protein n=1 Tax=Bradyrhizobium tropiciagri TaxID=312253 RepID=UPI0010099A09|nr:hypothetical protein [Bradyrhizobium tropiciagri]